MTETNTDVRDDAADIAWMRDLAEEGGRAPMRGAPILTAAGVVYGLTSLLHWAHLTGLIRSGVAVGTQWLIATVIFLVLNGLLIWRLRSAPGVRTAANRAIGVAWAGVGCGIFVLFASMWAKDLSAGPDQDGSVYWLIPSIIMVFYGVGWAVTAAMSKTKSGLLWSLAAGSFIAAPVLAALTGSPHQYLAYAIALFGLMALPGVLLSRSARR